MALSGPSFAIEVVNRQPTAVVVASADLGAAKFAQDTFSSAYFRTYTHADVIGVEIGGALKNVMAVATGIAEGLGLGFNARAALITRGLAEMTRLGTRLGAEASTLAGLAGLGDLVLTCTGSLSRNRSVGEEVGRGSSLEQVLAGRETVAEGVVTTRSAHALAKKRMSDANCGCGISSVVRQSPAARCDRSIDVARAEIGDRLMSPTEPVREFFSMGDVCTLTDLKPHVLRYWESQFRFLHPAKNRSGNRVYQRREIELIMLVRQLLYTEKYTIDGARQKIDEYRKSGELRSAARAALDSQTVESMEADLKAILGAIDGEVEEEE